MYFYSVSRGDTRRDSQLFQFLSQDNEHLLSGNRTNLNPILPFSFSEFDGVMFTAS